jgi:bifunctional non-homologous end joining protein LigD
MKRSRFVIHEHHATNLHFDFRLEIAGVLKSWAVPKGVSLNPNEKRLAVAVPDHAVSYIDFEGTLAEGTYGAGEVRIWDNGEFEIVAGQLEKGKLIFRLFGKKLQGEFALLRMNGNERSWLLIKSKDEYANLNWKLETVLPSKNKKAKS